MTLRQQLRYLRESSVTDLLVRAPVLIEPPTVRDQLLQALTSLAAGVGLPNTSQSHRA
eukprot:CAMPEP_0119514862 /NCGR_PEP_ID=MMETSP1344-20130328/32554_1 /TAXON_ID=236787 /ORGANISM="Florenciella parvula, Strain CCMP2471" /LENGTH=57 /DNA_ID=CAMNT_0007552219 /DNA_START=47 /DNA_END=216 /DNA_ORIENTATION=+